MELAYEDQLKAMSVRQLREILKQRGVDSSDCLEKSDLVSRVLKTEPPKGGAAHAIELPLEQWLAIFHHLPLASLGTVQRVSRDFHALANLPSLWRARLLEAYPPLIRSRVEGDGWKKTFEQCKRIKLQGGVWLIRYRGHPYVDLERRVSHSVLYTPQFNAISDSDGGQALFRMDREPPTTGLQVGPYFAVMVVVPRVGIISTGIREISPDGLSYSGIFLNHYHGRGFTSSGFTVGYKNRTASINDWTFNPIENSLPPLPPTTEPLLARTWTCTLGFPTSTATEIITLRLRKQNEIGEHAPKAGILVGHAQRYAAEIPAAQLDSTRTALAVAHPNGSVAITVCSPDWPSTRIWSALVWEEKEKEGQEGDWFRLRGYCLENTTSLRWGSFSATAPRTPAKEKK